MHSRQAAKLLTIWIIAVIGVALAAAIVASATEPAAEVPRLVELLRSDAPYMEKLRACKRLGELGAAEAIPALAELLRAEPNLSHAARIALEAIAHPDAGKALLDAVDELDGLRRVGVIQSLGVRREPAAAAVLVSLLRDADKATATAAARALGRIATAEAVRSLVDFLPEAPAEVRPAVGLALLDAAEHLATQGETAQAIRVLDLVAESPLPEPTRLAACRAALIYDVSNRRPRLAKLLSGDREAFRLAVEVSRTLPAEEVAGQVAAILPVMPPDRQPLVLELLGDLGQAEVLPTVRNFASAGDIRVRAAAIRCLGKLGDVSIFSLLLQAACSEETAIAQAAREGLARLPDPRVNTEIVSHLARHRAGPASTELLVLVELCGKRRIRESVAELLPLVDAADERVRQAAIASLGQVAGPEELPQLAARLLRPVSAQDQTALKEAVRMVAIRAADREAVARVLTNCLQEAPADLKAYLIEVLGAVGSSTALQAVSELVWDPEHQDVVTRVLGQWMSPAAASVLQEVAEKATDQRYRIRALRGYLRIARQFDLPQAERLWMFVQAIRLAERDEERLLALQGLTRMASSMGIEVPQAAPQGDALVDQSAAVALNVAERLADEDPGKVREVLQLVAGLSKNPEIQARAQKLTGKLSPK